MTVALAIACFLAGLAAGAALALGLARARLQKLERLGVDAATELGGLRRELTLAQRALDDLSRTDVLTGAANKRRVEERLAEEWPRHARGGHALSALMIELDQFKPYNSAYGARQGDACLKQVAAAFGAAVGRASDLVARWGGEKFFILLPETPADGARKVADNLREKVEALGIPHEASRRKIVTISVGVATVAPKKDGDWETLIDEAEAALGRAKKAGRNAVAE